MPFINGSHFPCMASLRTIAFATVFASTTAACAYSPTVGPYSVGGTVSGLTAGHGVMVTDSAGATIFVSANGRFVIENAFPDGAAYDIDAIDDPSLPAVRCTVTKGKGNIESADVRDVQVACAQTRFRISGAATGLTGPGLVLATGGQEIALAKDGTFQFSAPRSVGSAYAVTIAQQPDTATCEVTNASGTITSDVTNVTVACK